MLFISHSLILKELKIFDIDIMKKRKLGTQGLEVFALGLDVWGLTSVMDKLQTKKKP